MKIKQLKLSNFRQFKDLTIDFSVSPKNNVNIILAENSTGKTTLMQSVKWCLYGDAETKLDNLNDLLNYDVRYTSLNDKEKVIVGVEIEENGIDYLIKRTKEFHVSSNRKASEKIELVYKTDLGETMRLEGDPDSATPDVKKIKRMINGILSKDMSNYFLFDGERIESLGKNNSQSRNDIKQAINAINNFTIIENAIESLNNMNRNYQKEISIESTDKELKKITNDIHELEKNIADNEEEIDKKESKIHHMQNNVEELDTELFTYQEIENLVGTRKKIENELRREESQRDKINKQLIKQYTDYKYSSMIFLLNKKYKNIDFHKEHEENTIPGMKVEAIDYLIDREYCICGERLTEEHIEYLTLQRNHQPPISNTDLINTFENIIYKHSSSIEKDISDFERYRGEQINISESITDNRDLLKELDSQIGDSNTEQIKLKNEERASLKKDIIAEEKAKHVLQYQLNSWSEELKNKMKEHAEKMKEDKENKFNSIKLDLISESLDLLIKRNEAYRQEKKVELEQIANKHFSEIIYKNKKIKINENFEYTVIEENENIASPSEGERMAISMSLVLAIIAVHKNTTSDATRELNLENTAKEFSLVLDAAFAKVDENFSKNISEKLPQSVEQIILFSTERQYQGAVENSLTKYIGKKYLLSIPTDDKENSITNDDLKLLEG